MAAHDGLVIHADLHCRFCDISSVVVYTTKPFKRSSQRAVATYHLARCRPVSHCHGCCAGYCGLWSHTRKTRRSKQWRNQLTIKPVYNTWRCAGSHNIVGITTPGQRKPIWRRTYSTSRLWWQCNSWNNSVCTCALMGHDTCGNRSNHWLGRQKGATSCDRFSRKVIS